MNHAHDDAGARALMLQHLAAISHDLSLADMHVRDQDRLMYQDEAAMLYAIAREETLYHQIRTIGTGCCSGSDDQTWRAPSSMVEQGTFNPKVEGSSPSVPTPECPLDASPEAHAVQIAVLRAMTPKQRAYVDRELAAMVEALMPQGSETEDNVCESCSYRGRDPRVARRRDLGSPGP